MSNTTAPQLDSILRSIEAVQGVFVVLSNLFVLGLFYQEGIRGRLSSLHIISLTVSDILQGVINVPAVIYLTLDLRVGQPSCFWTIWLASMSAFTQIFIILTMTLDRYWAVVHPFHYRSNVTRKFTCGTFFVYPFDGDLISKHFNLMWTGLICVSWCIGISLGILSLGFRETPKDDEQLCFMVEEMFSPVFSGAVAGILIMPSHLVIIVLYFKIYKVIIRAVRRVSFCRSKTRFLNV